MGIGRIFPLAVVVLLCGSFATGVSATVLSQPAHANGRASVVQNYGKLPLSFEENRGQAGLAVRFLSHGPGYGLFLTAKETVLTLTAAEERKSGRKLGADFRQRASAKPAKARRTALSMRLAGGRTPSAIVGRDPLPGVVNYLKGKDPAQWRTGVPTYGKVEQRGVYPGIDLVFYGNPQQLEYDFVVQPGADPKAIRLRFEETSPARFGKARRAPRLDAGGDLVVPTALGDVRLKKPAVYQQIDGRKYAVEGRFVLHPPGAGQKARAGRGTEIGFQIAAYDEARPLVIDPVLAYSTYLGGGDTDVGRGIAVDAAGNAYITGQTESDDFPTVNAQYNDLLGVDAFVTKINPSGSQILYSTYLGGGDTDVGRGIAVDAAGNAYITGSTESDDFPTVNAKYKERWGGIDAFVTKLAASGSQIVFSTYLGGSEEESAGGIAVDNAGNAYVAGETWSADFPTVNALYPELRGVSDAFVTKINPSGSQVIYSSYLGGSCFCNNGANAIAVDGAGNAYITGSTGSADFPTVNAQYNDLLGVDAFVTKINPSGSQILYSTYLGGGNSDGGLGIAVDGAGNAYVTGETLSSDFPTVNALDGKLDGVWGAFVTKINPSGSQILYSTYLDGGNSDGGLGIAVDGAGNAYVAGVTWSADFPTVNAQYNDLLGVDAFVTKINPSGSQILYSTYLGGGDTDGGRGIAVDGAGNAYVTGDTGSDDFPTVNAQYKDNSGHMDAFVTKITADGLPPPEETVAVIMVHGFMGNPGSFSDDDKLYRDCPSPPPNRQEDPKNYDRECWKQNGPGNVIRLGEVVCQRDSYLRPECQPKMGRLLQKDSEVQGANLVIAKPFDYSDKTSKDRAPAGGDWTIQQLAGELAKHIKCVTDLDSRCVDFGKYPSLNKIDRVDIVSHSMGGLVARAYIAGMAEDRNAKCGNGKNCLLPYKKVTIGGIEKGVVRKITTVGTPHYGSLWASQAYKLLSVRSGIWAFGSRHPEQVKQLDLGSGFVWELHERWNALDVNDKPDLLAVAGTLSSSRDIGAHESDWDSIVNISSAVLPDLSDDHIRYVPYRHSSLTPPLNTTTLVGVSAAQHYTYQLVRAFLLGHTIPKLHDITDKSFYLNHGQLLVRLSDAETKLPVNPTYPAIDLNAGPLGFTCNPSILFWLDEKNCQGGAYTNADAGTISVLPLAVGDQFIEIKTPPYYEPSRTFEELSPVGVESARTKVVGPLYFNPMPDLTITQFSAPSCVSGGQTVSVSVRIQNNGKKQAEASALAISSGQTLLGNLSVQSLAPGASRTVQSRLAIPRTVYRSGVVASADSGNAIREWIETNNQRSTICITR